MLFYISQFMQTLLLPPCSNLVLVIIGFMIWRNRPIVGKAIVFISLISLWLLSTPPIAQKLINGLQYQYAALKPSQLIEDKNASIVVLEAGLIHSPEYEGPIVSEATLSRLRYSAFLYQKIKAPILVSGNDPTHLSINQTDYMANALKEYFGIPVKWKESKGFNTALEGKYTTEILKKSGINKIYLVTSAYHMPRSVLSFLNKGFEIIPSPTGFVSFEDPFINTGIFFPNTKALSISAIALHEYIGLIWYRLYYSV